MTNTSTHGGGMIQSGGVSAANAANAGMVTDVCSQNHVGSQIGQDDNMSVGGMNIGVNVMGVQRSDMETCKSEGTQAGGTLQQNSTTKSTGTGTRTKDYNDEMVRYEV